MNIAHLPTPAALIDRARLERNCGTMAARATRLGVRLRPHVKTHKSPAIATLQTAGHFGGITVSTLAEARGFADAGFQDITYAVPISSARFTQLDGLLATGVSLAVLVDQLEAARALDQFAENRGQRLSVWLKVDCGYHRAGVNPRDPVAIELARFLARSPRIDFRGLLTHAGHAYHQSGESALRAVATGESAVTVAFAKLLRDDGIEVPEVSVGSTPTLAVATAETLAGVTEVRPGNYVFFDAFQAAIGSCTESDIAFSVLASVISCRPDRLLLDAGAIALSKDSGPTHLDDDCGFGQVQLADSTPLPSLRITSLSQEHAVVRGLAADLERLTWGGRVRVVPNHSCLAAAAFDRYHVVRGDEVVDTWTTCRGF